MANPNDSGPTEEQQAGLDAARTEEAGGESAWDSARDEAISVDDVIGGGLQHKDD